MVPAIDFFCAFITLCLSFVIRPCLALAIRPCLALAIRRCLALDLEFEVLRVRAGGVEGARHGLQLGRGPLYLKFFGLLELQGAIITEGAAELV